MHQPLAPVEVFCSSVEEDAPFQESLERHLSLLRRSETIVLWHQRKVTVGGDWKRELDEHLGTASLILLLISPDFLASDYTYGVELQRAMQRHDDGQARVIPILLRPCDWEKAPFARCQMLPRNGQALTLWDNRDQAFTEIAKEIRKALEDRESVTSNPFPATFPKIWQIPYQRNPVFTGREQLLAQLAEALQTGHPTALSQPQAITGLGGIGKTQIAVEYAYRHRQDYKVVLWTRADTREALISGYVEIAGLLNLPQKNEQDQTLIVNAVLQWLKTQTAWLLILDNADDLAIVREFLPLPPAGHILLTTRAQAMGRLAKRMEVQTMDRDVGALLLLRRADLIAADASVEAASLSDLALARVLTQELDGLPLALDQAGAYIEEARCGLSVYHALYRQRSITLLNERRGLVTDHPEPVTTTWSLSFQKVEQLNAAAADLLRFCAYLAPDAIPEEIIITGAEHLGPLLQPLGADLLAFNNALAILGFYSLVNRDVSAKTVSVHRLVQAVLKEQMDEQHRQQWAQRTIHVIEAALPPVEHGSWSRWEQILAHALVCGELIESQQMQSAEAALLLQQTGWYLIERARYQEAEPLLEQALQISEEVQGGEHLSTARNASTLAYLYKSQGKYAEAEPLYVRALAIREQHLGAEHPETARSLNNLAGLYDHQGKYAEAEPLYVRALAIREQQLGAEHPDTASSLNNLATLYASQGKYAEAEPLYVRALAIFENILGQSHPSTQTVRANYVSLLQTMKQDGETKQ